MDADDWLLIIDGYVAHSITLNYNTLTSLSATTIHAALMCAGHTPTAPLLGEAAWRGAPFAALNRRAQPQARARYVTFSSADGYRTSFALAELTEAYIVHTMDGAPLPPEHGYPARLIVPGLAGYKMPKWLTHITFSDQPTPGLWERRGAPLSGIVDPITTIHAQLHGDTVVLSGEAYGGDTPISAVEIRIDSGPWMRVACSGDAGRLAPWQTMWTPFAPGTYTIEARAVAGDTRSKSQSTVVEVTT